MNAMPHDGRLDSLLPALKGAPAALFLALALNGGLQTTKSLARATGYSNKVVRQGLARLQALGLAQCEPDMHAWYLASRAELAALLFGALQTSVSPPNAPPFSDSLSAVSLHNLSTEFSTGADFSAPPVESSAAAEQKAPSHASQPGMAAGAPPQDGEALPDPAVENSPAAEESSVSAEEMTRTAEEKAASRAPDLPAFTAAADYSPLFGSAAAGKGARSARGSPQTSGRDRKELAAWLRKGGIAYRSTKMKDLLAAGLELEEVKAHVLERMAWEAGLIPEMSRFGVGLLIQRLLEGDPPPPMRCPQCLQRRDAHGRCRCHLEAAIHR